MFDYLWIFKNTVLSQESFSTEKHFGFLWTFENSKFDVYNLASNYYVIIKYTLSDSLFLYLLFIQDTTTVVEY